MREKEEKEKKNRILNFLMFEDQHHQKIFLTVASIQQLQTRTKNDQKKNLSILVVVANN